MSKLRPFSGIGIAAVLGGFLLSSATQGIAGEAPRPVKVSQIALADNMNQRLLPAEVRASERAGLSFRVSGEIMDILVQIGRAHV